MSNIQDIKKRLRQAQTAGATPIDMGEGVTVYLKELSPSQLTQINAICRKLAHEDCDGLPASEIVISDIEALTNSENWESYGFTMPQNGYDLAYQRAYIAHYTGVTALAATYIDTEEGRTCLLDLGDHREWMHLLLGNPNFTRHLTEAAKGEGKEVDPGNPMPSPEPVRNSG